ncbi:hypothetical protein LEP1GSC089_1567 [Leptospira interrogans serovar Autumnalis str. LP101]|nr:hypothetical protein LEP1GSC089_1567 [Leptospira interrogans serovar Autumnalis str. LP101]
MTLSPYTMQAYATGGYSKSSFNNIHWDEKSARKWACYATAGQLAAMAGYAAIYGAPGYGIGVTALGEAAFGLDNPYMLSFFSEQTLEVFSIIGTTKSALQGDWQSVGLDFIAYYSGIKGLSTIYSIGKGAVNTCEGPL